MIYLTAHAMAFLLRVDVLTQNNCLSFANHICLESFSLWSRNSEGGGERRRGT